MDLYHELTTGPVSRLEPVSVIEVAPDQSVGEVLATMQSHNVGSVVICREGRLAGIFTERDALRIITKGRDLKAPIESVMTADPVTVRSADTLGNAIQRMDRGAYRRVPIVDEQGRPVGMVTVKSLVRYLVEHFPATVYNLPPVTQHTTRDREGA